MWKSGGSKRRDDGRRVRKRKRKSYVRTSSIFHISIIFSAWWAQFIHCFRNSIKKQLFYEAATCMLLGGMLLGCRIPNCFFSVRRCQLSAISFLFVFHFFAFSRKTVCMLRLPYVLLTLFDMIVNWTDCLINQSALKQLRLLETAPPAGNCSTGDILRKLANEQTTTRKYTLGKKIVGNADPPLPLWRKHHFRSYQCNNNGVIIVIATLNFMSIIKSDQHITCDSFCWSEEERSQSEQWLTLGAIKKILDGIRERARAFSWLYVGRKLSIWFACDLVLSMLLYIYTLTLYPSGLSQQYVRIYPSALLLLFLLSHQLNGFNMNWIKLDRCHLLQKC